jgi:hypothetical protein
MNIPSEDDSKPPGDFSHDDEKLIRDTQREGVLNQGQDRKKPPVQRQQGFQTIMPVTSMKDAPVGRYKKKRASWKKPEVGLHV